MSSNQKGPPLEGDGTTNPPRAPPPTPRHPPDLAARGVPADEQRHRCDPRSPQSIGLTIEGGLDELHPRLHQDRPRLVAAAATGVGEEQQPPPESRPRP